MEIHHTPGKHLAIADGLSRLRTHPSYIVAEENSEFSLPALCPVETTDPEATAGQHRPADTSDENQQASSPKKEEWKAGWEPWSEDPWYSQLLEYKVTGKIEDPGPLEESELKLVAANAKRIILIDDGGTEKRLGYRERSGKIAKCIHPGEVRRALELIHNVHGHFSADITMQRTLGKFYWPYRR